MVVHNYSKIIKQGQKESKLYVIAGIHIPGGVSTKVILLGAPFVILWLFIGWLISLALPLSMFNFLAPDFNASYLVVFLAMGIITTVVLWSVTFAGYRLIEYLVAYCRPRKSYTNMGGLADGNSIGVETCVKSYL